MRENRPAAVFFDLDGTLVDTAPDLAEACNRVLDAQGIARLSPAYLRTMAGAGARGMLGLSLGLKPEDQEFASLAESFFQHYLSLNNQHSVFFADMETVLDQLDAQRIPWGIITNKATRFTEPLLRTHPRLLGAAAIICGDTTPHAKPHPAPMREACRRAGVDAAHCWYVGDDKRDIDAAHAVQMHAIAAAWGYGGEHAIDTWAADCILAQPTDLLNLLKQTT